MLKDLNNHSFVFANKVSALQHAELWQILISLAVLLCPLEILALIARHCLLPGSLVLLTTLRFPFPVGMQKGHEHYSSNEKCLLEIDHRVSKVGRLCEMSAAHFMSPRQIK